MNRVEDFYLTFSKFLAMPEMAQYIIATSFCVVQWHEFQLNPEALPDMVIRRVMEKKMYQEFKQVVGNYKEAGKNESGQ